MFCHSAGRRLLFNMPSFALFLARFLKSPKQVASIIPSSAMMVRRVSDKMNLARPCVVAEYGPGEGVHTREMLKRSHPESKFLLFELAPEFCRDLVAEAHAGRLDPAKKSQKTRPLAADRA